MFCVRRKVCASSSASCSSVCGALYTKPLRSNYYTIPVLPILVSGHEDVVGQRGGQKFQLGLDGLEKGSGHGGRVKGLAKIVVRVRTVLAHLEIAAAAGRGRSNFGVGLGRNWFRVRDINIRSFLFSLDEGNAPL